MMTTPSFRLRWRGVLLLALVTATTAAGDDWPQWLGPRRDGTSKETGLKLNWGKDGPPLVWQKDVGEGFSGPVVAGGKLILFHRLDGKEVVDCLDAATGDRLWRTEYACDYSDSFGKGDGPRSTPLIAGGRVVTLGADGRLQGLALQDGKRLWARALRADYRVPDSFFGVGTSPLADDGRVLVNVGGKDAGIVAFALADGKELWKATDDEASYSSPVLADLGGKKRAVFFTRFGPVILDPATGEVLHRQRWRARYAASVNAATPLVGGDLLFFSASYETGALALRHSGGRFAEAWKDDEAMSNHFNTCVLHDGHLYGLDGRQEVGPQLRCVELATGQVKWTKKDSGFGCASMVAVGGRVIALTEGGALVAFEPSPAGYREVARARELLAGPCRAQPALADGKLYARDNTRLACWDLRK